MADLPGATSAATPGALPKQSSWEKHPLAWGTGLAAGGAGLAGLISMLMSGNMGGQEAKAKQLPLYSPQTMKGLESLFGQGMQNADFSGIENRARQQFNTQTVPSLAERFTSMGGQGSQGGQRSSAFGAAVGGAGADLESQLANLRSQFGMQQLHTGLTPQFENIYNPRQPGFGENAGNAAMEGIMKALPYLLTLL